MTDRLNLPCVAALIAGLSLAACGSSGKPDRDGATRGPAPYGALTSGEEALKIVFDKVCLPTVLGEGDFVTLAKTNYMVEVKPAKDSTGQTSQRFGLASMANAEAVLWADGTCTISLQRGDPEAYRAQMLETLAAHGQVMSRGKADVAARNGRRTSYCNPDPRPLMLIVIVPGDNTSKRNAVVANLRRATGGAHDICLR